MSMRPPSNHLKVRQREVECAFHRSMTASEWGRWRDKTSTIHTHLNVRAKKNGFLAAASKQVGNKNQQQQMQPIYQIIAIAFVLFFPCTAIPDEAVVVVQVGCIFVASFQLVVTMEFFQNTRRHFRIAFGLARGTKARCADLPINWSFPVDLTIFTRLFCCVRHMLLTSSPSSSSFLKWLLVRCFTHNAKSTLTQISIQRSYNFFFAVVLFVN